MPKVADYPRYMIECQEGIFQNYTHVDMTTANKVSKEVFNLIVDTIADPKEGYPADLMMVIMAMLVGRMAFEMDNNSDVTGNLWGEDGFPEFCSMIGPNSGLHPTKIRRRQANALGRN
jgi:hypothetical protein